MITAKNEVSGRGGGGGVGGGEGYNTKTVI